MDLDPENVTAKLATLIEQAVTSGQKEIDPKIFKEIKNLCRHSDKNVNECHKLLLHQLSKKHSEIRLAAFQICIELFQRSHVFRENISADFSDFSKLVLDIDSTSPLPPPVPAARKLKQLATKTIKEWNNVYGEAYKKLRIGFKYLKQSHIVDFEDGEAMNAIERQRVQAREAQIQKIKAEKLKILREEICKVEAEINDCITQIENAFELLIPKFEKFGDSELDDGVTILREHGITKPGSNLVIKVNKIEIKMDQDNQDIITSLTDQYRLLTNRYQPMVLKWNISASKLGADQQFQLFILKMKNTIESLVEKYNEINLPAPSRKTDSPSESDDSDLESVCDKEGYEETVCEPIHLPIACQETCSDPQPGSSSTKHKEKLTKNLNAKSIDIDSYKADHHAAPTMSTNQIESFWVNTNDDESVNDPSRTAGFFTHHIELSEEFVPVKWACRAPLSNGSLCPRKDRQKCPFHGPIIARDELGNPVDASAIPASQKPQIPEWQDPTLLAEIKAATGVDLTIPAKGKRLRKNKYPNLTDVKSLTNTPRNRLEKKVFNKTVVKRIAAHLDAADRKKTRDKFRDQWNYAYDQ